MGRKLRAYRGLTGYKFPPFPGTQSIFLLLIAALVFGGLTMPTAYADTAKPESADWNRRLNELANPKPNEIVMTAIGDALWTRKISDIRESSLQSIFKLMRNADIAYMNLEVPLPEQGYPEPKKVAMAHPSMISEFKWAGTDIVATANNHMMDYGAVGLESTIKILDDNGIKHSGAGTDLAAALQPAFVESKGVRVAFLSFMVGSPSQRPSLVKPAGSENPGVAPVRGSEIRLADGKTTLAPWQEDMIKMEQAIREAKKQADMVIVSYHIHWGDRDEVTTGKRIMARAAIDAGADMIIGHGPHVLNGIEIYQGKPILYSISHFFFQLPLEAFQMFPGLQDTLRKNYYADPRLYESVFVRATIGPNAEIKRLELLPVEVSKQGDPHFVTGKMADTILNRIATMSKELGTKVKRKSWYAVVDL